MISSKGVCKYQVSLKLKIIFFNNMSRTKGLGSFAVQLGLGDVYLAM